MIETARYYENRVTTLGVQFVDEADRAVETILQAPERWRIIEKDIRSFVMYRFPYSI